MNYSYSYNYNVDSKLLIPYLIVMGVITVVLVIAEWRLFKKANKPGWAVIVPFYNTWVEYEIISGHGANMFRLLIPFYNIYWWIKSMIALAHAYGKSTGFGVGLIFLPAIFLCILGFGKDEYVGPQDM